MKTYTTITPTNDVKLLDKAFLDLNAKMLTSIGWLDNAFGMANKINTTTKEARPKTISFPAVYKGNGNRQNNYINLLPNSGYGNFSYFQVTDYTIDKIPHQTPIVKAKFGLIFWFNASKAYSNEARNIEKMKEDVINFFSRSRVVYLSMDINSVTQDNADIYKEYGTKDIEQQYLMHPYGGFRFEGELTYAPIECN